MFDDARCTYKVIHESNKRLCACVHILFRWKCIDGVSPQKKGVAQNYERKYVCNFAKCNSDFIYFKQSQVINIVNLHSWQTPVKNESIQ